MEALLNKRRSVEARITRIENRIHHESENFNEQAKQLFITKLNSLSRELDIIQGQIDSVVPTEDLDTQQHHYDELMRKMEDLIITLATPHETVSDSTNRSPTEVKLPRIYLPVFRGNIDDWLSFHDLFITSVHNNKTLSDVQKFQYLKSSLRDEAAVLVKAIPVTNENYQQAWSILQKRFHNPREIVHSLIKRLMTEPKLTKGTSAELRHLADHVDEIIVSLKVLNEPVEHWDSLLVYILGEKLDQETRKQWELVIKDDERPTYASLHEFLDKRARALAASQDNYTSPKVKTHESPTHTIHSGSKHRKPINTHVNLGQCRVECIFCKQSHSVFKCPELMNAPTPQRKSMVRERSLCSNCLRSGHSVSQCTSSHVCRHCNQKHHTLLHEEPAQASQLDSAGNAVTVHTTSQNSACKKILLSTALIHILDCDQQPLVFRALLDSASEATLISERCAQLLRLRRHCEPIDIIGIAESGSQRASGAMYITVSSPIAPTAVISTKALILPKVTRATPSFTLTNPDWPHLKGIQLADPKFYISGTVDVILGADVFNELILEGVCKGSPDSPTARNTVFGWVISGPAGHGTVNRSISVSHCQVSEQLSKFWELEEVPETKFLSPEEEFCEQHFLKTHSRQSDGRYCVRLPFRSDSPKLGESKHIADVRLHQVEKRLSKNEELRQKYVAFLDEYQRLGHMKPIPTDTVEPSLPFAAYLPHHPVLRPDSSTTSLRVVFNGSSPTSTGISLNDCLHVGPKTQQDIWSILLRFRTYPIALVADIEKMFRQILIHPSDQNFQLIRWRPSPDEEIQTFQLCTVTYGTGCAPYLANRTLQQLAHDEGDDTPLAKQAVLNDFYVDDLISGANSLDDAKQLHLQLMDLLKRGGFHLRKWASNSPELLKSIGSIHSESEQAVSLELEEGVKTLGLKWRPVEDILSFKVQQPDLTQISKRRVLSEISRLYDPLGLVSPIVVVAKSFIQRLWMLGVEWDEGLPSELQEQWKQYCSELTYILQIKVPRCITSFGHTGLSVQLHGFSDASEQAMAAAVYLRQTTPQGSVTTHLLCSKTKLAPLKQLSIPRLELCAAQLLAKLLKQVQSSLRCAVDKVVAWTDSTIVLCWLQKPPRQWKTFVANRVSLIQELISPSCWRHVTSVNNPADISSRGATAQQLMNSSLWWEGPIWLSYPESQWPMSQLEPTNLNCVPEQRKVSSPVCATATLENLTATASDNANPFVSWELVDRYSSLSKLKRVTAWCLRFIHNCKSGQLQRKHGHLSASELYQALLLCVKAVQHQSFPDTFEALQKTKQVKTNLSSLSPFVDTDGLLRVGGRLMKSPYAFDKRCPMLLPKNHHFTDLIINASHLAQLHGGVQATLAAIRQQFWILHGRSVVKRVLHLCHTCLRDKRKLQEQKMGLLPDSRLEPVRPFLRVGVDFAGPFSIVRHRGRGARTDKAYFALFICFASKAIHLEAVSDLTTASFLAALKRFIARRGICAEITSDNGKNFKGADSELKKLLLQVCSPEFNATIADEVANIGIKWNFIPPRSPHFGGLWEAGVKSAKTLFRRIVGETKLTYEEFSTILAQIEACLNSRPLCALSNDPSDLNVLTPGHFLIGEALTCIPEPDLTEIKANRLVRWRMLQQLFQRFWKRWKNEYITQLHPRNKWKQPNPNLAVGDLVLIRDGQSPPLFWSKGRVSRLFPGPDGLVRVVEVRTARGDCKLRPIVKLCRLPIG